MSCMCTRIRGGTTLRFVLEKCKNWTNLERIGKSWSWNVLEYIRYWGILEMWRYWIGRKDNYNGQEACAYRFWKMHGDFCLQKLLKLDSGCSCFFNEIENWAIVYISFYLFKFKILYNYSRKLNFKECDL